MKTINNKLPKNNKALDRKIRTRFDFPEEKKVFCPFGIHAFKKY